MESFNLDTHYRYVKHVPSPLKRKTNPNREAFGSLLRIIFSLVYDKKEIDTIHMDSFLRYLEMDMKEHNIWYKVSLLSPLSMEFYYTFSYLYNINIYLINTNTIYMTVLRGWKFRPILSVSYCEKTNQFTQSQELLPLTAHLVYEKTGDIRFLKIKRLKELRKMGEKEEIDLNVFTTKELLIQQLAGIINI